MKFETLQIGEMFRSFEKGKNILVKTGENSASVMVKGSELVYKKGGGATFDWCDTVYPVSYEEMLAQVNPKPEPKYKAGEVVYIKDTPKHTYLKPDQLVRIEGVDKDGEYSVTGMVLLGSGDTRVCQQIGVKESYLTAV